MTANTSDDIIKKTRKEKYMTNIRFTPLVDQVYADIKRRIVTGDIEPNDKLNVRALCEYYSISDTPLKQALNRLVSEKLVVAIPRCGMRVAKFSSKDIHDAIEARIMIETFAVPAAIKAAKTDTSIIASLEKNLQEDETLIRSTNVSSYSDDSQREIELSQEFHMIIVRSLNNRTISDAYTNITSHRYVYYQSGSAKTAQALASVNEHRQIFERMKAGDEEGMKASIIAHLKAREYDVSTVSDE